MPTTDIQDTVYHQPAALAIIVLNVVSFLTLAFVLSIYAFKWKKIASFPMRLSFYLCLACLLQNLYVIMLNPILVDDFQRQGGTQTSGFCEFEGVLKVTSDLSSIIWTTLIIYSAFASVVLKKNLDQAEISYLILGYGFPLIFAIMYFYLLPLKKPFRPIFFKLYGYNTYYCWFDDQDLTVQFGLKMGYYYVPLWLCFFLNVIMSIKTYRTLVKLGLGKRQLVIFKRLMLFPLIMLVTAFFDTVNEIYNYASGDYPAWLDILANVFTALYGFFNSIAYGFNPIIREQIEYVFGIKKEPTNEEMELSDNNSQRSSRRQTEGREPFTL